jgi:hypothetical protein
VRSAVTDLLTGYFAEELVDERDLLRDSLTNSPPDARRQVGDEFRELLATRTMTVEEIRKATATWFDDEQQMYAALADAYRYLFGDEPPSPA